jgi:hypothetical protein
LNIQFPAVQLYKPVKPDADARFRFFPERDIRKAGLAADVWLLYIACYRFEAYGLADCLENGTSARELSRYAAYKDLVATHPV